MKTAAVVFGLALCASAARAPPAESVGRECSFGINAYGVEGTASEGYWGKVKQLSDGQLRIGQSDLKTASKFYLNQDYGLYDQNHFGCILAGWEEQFQCDSGKDSSAGWDIGYEGLIILQGSVQFWACPTGDHDGLNIYKRPLAGSAYCYQVTLVADQCHAVHSSPSSHCNGSSCAAPAHKGTSYPTPACNGPKCRTCPGELSGEWEFPHLIVSVEANKPEYAPGTSLFGTVSDSTRSYFNFDIPSYYANKTCTVKFLFPHGSQLETSSFVLKGSGEVLAGWAREVSKSTSYETAPELMNEVRGTLEPGNSYVLGRGDCRPGVMGFAMEGVSDTYLRWFQDFNPCPIGLYLIAE